MKVRERTDADLDACVALAREVHEADGYPPYLPTAVDVFVATPGALGAWVADDDDRIVGHVALHPHTTPAAIGLVCEHVLLPPDALGVVSRMFVAPGARRRGAGRALLDTAVAAAHSRDLQPMLDVAVQFTGAIAFYEQCGWKRVGIVTVRLPNGDLDEYVYLPPDAKMRR